MFYEHKVFLFSVQKLETNGHISCTVTACPIDIRLSILLSDTLGIEQWCLGGLHPLL